MEEAKEKKFGSPVPKKEKSILVQRVSDTYLKRPTAFWKPNPFYRYDRSMRAGMMPSPPATLTLIHRWMSGNAYPCVYIYIYGVTYR